MTTYQDSSTDDKKEQAKQAASTAADEGKHVAGVAGEEAKAVAGEAKEHVKGLLDDTVTQVGEASKSQRDSLVSTLQGLTDDLQKMAGSEGGSGLAGELASQVADRAKSLSSHLDGREPADLLNDVRDFARQRPGTFLLGALVAGVVAGRLARGAKAAQSDDSGPAAPSTPSAAPVYTPPTSYDAPVTPATTGFPTTPPVDGPLSAPDTGAPGVPRVTTLPTSPDSGATVVAQSDPPAKGGDRSLGEIVSDITTDLTTLMRQELDLAKTELKQEVTKLGVGAGMLAGAGVAGHFVLIFLSLAGMFGLDTFLPLWLSALIVMLVWAVIAAVLALLGRKNIQNANPQLPQTQESLKEDAQWAKAQKN